MDAEERKTAMSHNEMQDYWKTLCSFTGEDIPNEVNQLMAKIRYLILSILVDTFSSRISLTMPPSPKPHNTACVLS